MSCDPQVMEELKRLRRSYQEEVGVAPEMVGVALSSRKNLCIHPEVSRMADTPVYVDANGATTAGQ